MEEITTTYRGQKITFEENTEKWSCEVVSSSETSLFTLKKKIDKHLKAENANTNTKALLLIGYNRQQMIDVTITSVTEEGDAWVRREKDGSREKVRKSSIGNLIKITLENEKIIASVKFHEEVALANQEAAKKLTASLERVFKTE